MNPQIVNLEEQPGKVVGRVTAAMVDYDRLVDAAEKIMPPLRIRRGAYKFRSFQEANEWMDNKILQAARTRFRERQGEATLP